MNIQPAKVELEIKNEDRVPDAKKPRAKPKTCPTKASKWFITINTNIYLNDKNESEATDIKNKFANVLADLLPSFDNFVEMHTSKLGESYGYGKDDSREILCAKDRIIDVSLKYVLEISGSGRLHAHIEFFLRKRGVDTKINMEALKKAIDERMAISCYVNYKLHNASMNIEEYMKKNPIN